MKTIKINPEFAHELACAIPHAYWLHKQGKLDKVITSKDMKPFYYFCDNVEEQFTHRTVSTLEGGMTEDMIPMNWIHGSNDSEGNFQNGVLDYSLGWEPPSYVEHYKNEELKFDKPFIVINNIFNIESGNHISKSKRYINLETLNKLFNYLTEKGYIVIYKRPNNTEFIVDQNELQTIQNNISLAEHTNHGKVSDYDLCNYYDGNVININSLKEKYPQYSYNEFQLRLFSNANGFVSVNGGGSILCAYFGKPVIVYVPAGKELRENYLDNPNSYFKKLGGCDVYPVLDPGEENNYSKLINKVKEIF